MTSGGTRFDWRGCEFGASVEAMLLDEPFAFQSWWLDDVLARFIAVSGAVGVQSEPRSTARPKFVRPVPQSSTP